MLYPKKNLWAVCALSLIFSLTSCQNETNKSVKENPQNVKSAIAIVRPLKDSEVQGRVTFTAVDGGVNVVAELTGLKPGKHGFHIHEFGDCSASDGSSAGGHYNPTNKQHGSPDSENRHVGDLGNITAGEDGIANYKRIDKVINLNGANSIIGKSIIIHEGEDDFKTQPAGNSGARIACGVIEAHDSLF